MLGCRKLVTVPMSLFLPLIGPVVPPSMLINIKLGLEYTLYITIKLVDRITDSNGRNVVFC